jgi:hypothetical protein
LLTAWPKLNTGPWSNQTKALAELRRKCGKRLANSECPANSSALQIIIPLRAIHGCCKIPAMIYVSGFIARTEEGFA